MDKHFTFSFIMPAYNCEEYLSEAVESVLSQTIGFEDNIQIVLINDGSSDNTGEICKTYQELFPDNIIYINQENQGASASRLNGLKVATGTYINCLDADDKWTEDACVEALRMLQLYPEVPFVAARHQFFGARTSKHPLSYKYRNDCVVNLKEVWDYPHLSMSNAFIRRELIKPEYFNHKLKVSEDFLVVNRILLRNPQYAIISKPSYMYRKRESHNSAIDQSMSTVSWYFDPPTMCYKQLFIESKERYGEVLPFIQFTIMYDLQWRIKDAIPHPLNDEQFAEYKRIVVDLLKDIDDAIILDQHNMFREQRLYALALKYETTVDAIKKELYMFGGFIWWKPSWRDVGLRCWKVDLETKMHIDFMTREGDEIVLEGRISTFLPDEKAALQARIKLESAKTGKGKKAVSGTTLPEETIVEAEFFPRYDESSSAMFDKDYHQAKGFKLRLPCGVASFMVAAYGFTHRAQVDWSKYARYWSTKFGYTPFGDIVVRQGPSANSLRVEHRDHTWLLKRELLLDKSIATKKWGPGIIKYRHHAIRHRKDQDQVWLISDRPTMAGDSGEALFAYLQQHPFPNVKTYFVINADSPDYQRLRSIGPVVPFHSSLHKKLHMQTSMIISSAADDFVYNCFGKSEPAVRSLERYRFVFLQHGIIKDDMSKWLNRYNKNIAIFVTSAEREKRSIVDTKAYCYTDEQVLCSGLPRHDKLLDLNEKIETENYVLVAPTWRHHLAGETDPDTGKRLENPEFTSTDYYLFYNQLLNDERVAEAFAAKGYRMGFLIHPALMQEAHKFTSDYADILTEYDYPTEFSKAQIMITDFSSVAFDFALLRKPLLYAQFDFDSFFANHMWDPGYFDYVDDGMGPVCRDYDSTVETLLGYLDNPVMGEMYRTRADEFFYEPATSRCQEVAEAIYKLSMEDAEGR